MRCQEESFRKMKECTLRGGGCIRVFFLEIPMEHFGNSPMKHFEKSHMEHFENLRAKKRYLAELFRPKFACVFWFVSRKMPWIEELCLELRSRQELSDVKRESSSNSVSCC